MLDLVSAHGPSIAMKLWFLAWWSQDKHMISLWVRLMGDILHFERTLPFSHLVDRHAFQFSASSSIVSKSIELNVEVAQLFLHDLHEYLRSHSDGCWELLRAWKWHSCKRPHPLELDGRCTDSLIWQTDFPVRFKLYGFDYVFDMCLYYEMIFFFSVHLYVKHMNYWHASIQRFYNCNVKSWQLQGEATVLDLKLGIQTRLAVPRKEQRLAATRHISVREFSTKVALLYLVVCQNQGMTWWSVSVQ